jgi:glutamate racemase
MEPAVKPAARSTETGVVGVLATAAALAGELYRATAARYGEQVRIIEAVGEGFVELVEADREESPEAFETVRRVVQPMLEAGADRIVLGCTHYPFLAEQIARVIEEHSLETGSKLAQIVDSAPAIARRVEQLLDEDDLRAAPDNTPRHHFMTFATPDYLEHLKRKSAKILNFQ